MPCALRSALCALLLTSLLPAEEVKLVVAKAITPEMEDTGSPVKIPSLDYYSKLWTESLLTSRALPPPEAPAGPKFTDNLTLTGTYEMNGKIVAVLIDRTTANVLEAYIGEDNAEGMRIVKVEGASAADISKVQLQKGTEMGWVGMPDPNNPEGGAPPPSAPVVTGNAAVRGLMPNPHAPGAVPSHLPPGVAPVIPPVVPESGMVPAIPDPPQQLAPGDVPLPPP